MGAAVCPQRTRDRSSSTSVKSLRCRRGCWSCVASWRSAAGRSGAQFVPFRQPLPVGKTGGRSFAAHHGRPLSRRHSSTVGGGATLVTIHSAAGGLRQEGGAETAVAGQYSGYREAQLTQEGDT